MIYSEAKQGRVFVIRLEDGDIVHEELERFAVEHSIKAASLIIFGGVDRGSRLFIGPERGRSDPIMPMEYTLEGVHEITGTGTIFPDSNGQPLLHCHIAGGRKDSIVAGSIRSGVRVWHVMEVILYELTDTTATRQLDEHMHCELLHP